MSSNTKNMIYIHVPFCASRCIYCDFYSTTYSSEYREKYVVAACAELKTRRNYLPNPSIQSIYLGGGTPSLLTLRQIEKLLQTTRELYQVDTDTEVTIEANPDDIDALFAKSLSGVGVNRVSLGVQSFSDSTLRMLNRRHTSSEAEKAVNVLYSSGINNISIDLIYGLPGQSLQQFTNDLTKAFSLPIKHLSAYALSIEEGTPLDRKIANGELSETDEALYIEAYAKLMEKAEQNGFEHYEISNFSLPGFASRHNSGYWSAIPYLGIGPGAHSFNGTSRRFNLPDLKTYLSSEDNFEFKEEVLTPSEQFDELLFTSLRTSNGLNLDSLKQRFSAVWYEQLMKEATPHLIANRLELSGSILRLTRSGIMTSNDVISDLMRAE